MTLANASVAGNAVSVAALTGASAVGDGLVIACSRRVTAVSRMAVSVKLAGATSVISSTGVDVGLATGGSGVTLAISSVAVAVATLTGSSDVGDGRAVACSRRVTGGSRMAVSVKLAGATSVTASAGVEVALASGGSGVTLAIASVAGNAVSVAALTGASAVGDGRAVACSRRVTAVARMAVSVKLAGVISAGSSPGADVALACGRCGVTLKVAIVVGGDVWVVVAAGVAACIVGSVGSTVGLCEVDVESRTAKAAANRIDATASRATISSLPRLRRIGYSSIDVANSKGKAR